MVYNFICVWNYTDHSIRVENLADHRDDYQVGPKAGAAHDAWLAQSADGAKGVTLTVNEVGRGLRQLLHMWHHDWDVCYRVGNQPVVHRYDPHAGGSMEFWIDVSDDHLELRRVLDGKHRTVAVVEHWPAVLEGIHG